MVCQSLWSGFTKIRTFRPQRKFLKIWVFGLFGSCSLFGMFKLFGMFAVQAVLQILNFLLFEQPEQSNSCLKISYEDETFGFWWTLAQVIDIPYQDGLKMTIIMPEGNLHEFESGLSTGKMNHYFQATVTHRDLILEMPKFKFGVTYDLKKEWLEYNNFVEIFKSRARPSMNRKAVFVHRVIIKFMVWLPCADVPWKRL